MVDIARTGERQTDVSPDKRSDQTKQAITTLLTNELPLCGVVTLDRPCRIEGTQLFRCYGSVITSSTQINGEPSVTRNPVLYRVGVSGTDITHQMAAQLRATSMSQRFEMNGSLAAELAGLNRRYSNFTGSFKYADFSAMLERLGRGFALYAARGELTYTQLAGGAPINIRALAVYDDPVSASTSTVFIPRTASMIEANATFAALLAAANGSGATVATDVVNMDANANAPQIMTSSNAALAMGCINAARMLLHIMDMSTAGAIGAYAFTVGMHKILTVVGHTDEGAVMRDAIRRTRFHTPYGGVYVAGVSEYIGIPMPDITCEQTFQALADSVVLMTAAAVAVSDPLVKKDGRMYPTIITSLHGQTTTGAGQVGNDADAISLANQLYDASGIFCNNYVTELASIFNVSAGNVETAAAILHTAIGDLALHPNRHLMMKVAAPFYWIEPTTLYKYRSQYRLADVYGYGPLCGTMHDADVKYMGAHKIFTATTAYTQLAVEYTTARTQGFILHHALSHRDGLGAVKILQATPHAFALRGGANENIEDSMTAGLPISDYLWQRGDGGIPAPAELLYTDNTIGITVGHQAYDDNYNITLSNMKSMAELLGDQNVRISASPPTFIHLTTIGARTRAVINSRTRAANALQAVRGAFSRGMKTGGEMMSLSFAAPSIRMDSDANNNSVPTAMSQVGMAAPHSNSVTVRGPTAGTVVRQETVRPATAQQMRSIHTPISGRVMDAVAQIDGTNSTITRSDVHDSAHTHGTSHMQLGDSGGSAEGIGPSAPTL